MPQVMKSFNQTLCASALNMKHLQRQVSWTLNAKFMHFLNSFPSEVNVNNMPFHLIVVVWKNQNATMLF